MKIPKDRRKGFSLIELLCILFLLAVTGEILVILMLNTLAMERAQSASWTQMLLNQTLADQFRADVNQAEKAPLAWDKYRANPQTLILQMPSKEHVVYHRQDGQWQRLTVAGQKTSSRPMPTAPGQWKVEFSRAEKPSKLLRMHLHPLRREIPIPGQTLVIDASLGGD